MIGKHSDGQKDAVDDERDRVEEVASPRHAGP